MKWEETPEGLVREFGFKTYLETFGFATQIALVAQRLNHHPKLIVEYNRLRVETMSHDVGGKITERDHKLAEAIDKLQLPAGKQEAEELKLLKEKVKKDKDKDKKAKKKKLEKLKRKLNGD
ncbi:MAG TPA: 4a-hydroxytetrahydrobiopterin dehydratase [Chitinophagales bacterium]|nr:4a-hydroxytetrahydrobiopterin dehydratase [Chitinophagales bacterium]